MGITWPANVPYTADNVLQANRIINDSRIDVTPVTLKHISANPQIYIRKMYDILIYIENYNDDQIRLHNEVQAECSCAWVKQIISGNDIFQMLNRRRKTRLAFHIFRNNCDATNFENRTNLSDVQERFLVELINTTRRQLQNSIEYLAADLANNRMDIQECFRPEMNLTITKYKLFSLVPEWKYVPVDYPHLKSFLIKVRDELGLNDDLLDEGTGDNRHVRATHMFSQTFDFESLRLDIN